MGEHFTPDFYQWLILVLLSIIAYFLRSYKLEQDKFKETITKDIQELGKEVAILLDRDRRKRLTDYEQASNLNGV